MCTYFSESALTVFGKSSIVDNTPVRFSGFPKLNKPALWHGYSSVNVLHIFRRPFPKKNLSVAASERTRLPSGSMKNVFMKTIFLRVVKCSEEHFTLVHGF